MDEQEKSARLIRAEEKVKLANDELEKPENRRLISRTESSGSVQPYRQMIGTVKRKSVCGVRT